MSLGPDVLKIIFNYKKDMEILDKIETVINENERFYKRCYWLLINSVVFRRQTVIDLDNFLATLKRNSLLQIFYWSLFKLRKMEIKRRTIWNKTLNTSRIYFFTIPHKFEAFNVRKLLTNLEVSDCAETNTVDQILRLINSHICVQDP